MKILTLMLFSGLTVVVISVIILSSVPPVSRDALTHHLAIPKLWLKHGGIYEIPAIPFSYYPMNLDLLYAVSLYLGNDIIPKYIHFVFALLTAGLIFFYLKRRLCAAYGLLGALFFLSVPVVLKLSLTVYVDLGLIFFTTSALLLLLKWQEEEFRTRYLILSGIFCGLALGTKYNGLITFFILSCCVPILYLRRVNKAEKQMLRGKKISVFRQLTSLKHAAIFMIVALLVFSPWMVKNIFWTGNPVYPLYNSFFSGIIRSLNTTNDIPHSSKHVSIVKPKEKKATWDQNPFTVRKYIYQEHWWQTALIPVRIFLEGRDDDPKYFDGKLNPFLLILPLFAFVAGKGRNKLFQTELKFLTGFSLFYLLFVFFQIDMRIRWMAPTIPPLVMVSMVGLDGFHRTASKLLGKGDGRRAIWIVLMVAIIMLGMNSRYLIKQFGQVRPFHYIFGEITRDEYIQRRRPEYHSIQYANSHLHEDAKILSVFLGRRLYYSDIEMDFGEGILIKAFERIKSPDSISHYLKKRGFTHLMIRYDIFNNWMRNNFSETQIYLVDRFFGEEATLLTSRGGYGLYRIDLYENR